MSTKYRASETGNQNLKIVVAPDKFKGSLSAQEVCMAIQRGIHRILPEAEVILHPLADGGEGSLDILTSQLEVESVEAIVQDPLLRPVRASYLKSKARAYIEMAQASGLPLLKPAERAARRTTTFGTGQLIRNAWQRGVRELLLFIGGSATNDGGIGMAAALGYRFLDKHGQLLRPVGEELVRLERIDADNLLIKLADLKSTVVSDVRNPLYGEMGAARVFAPQKGASEEDVHLLDEGLRRLAEVIQKDLGIEVGNLPGAGAAGGLGAGGVAFLGADIQSGIHTMIHTTGLLSRLEDVALIITGEGMLDGQSLQGKVVAGVAEIALQKKIPCMVIAGNTSLSPTDYEPLGIRKVYTVMQEGLSLEEAIREAKIRVEDLGALLISHYIS